MEKKIQQRKERAGSLTHTQVGNLYLKITSRQEAGFHKNSSRDAAKLQSWMVVILYLRTRMSGKATLSNAVWRVPLHCRKLLTRHSIKCGTTFFFCFFRQVKGEINWKCVGDILVGICSLSDSVNSLNCEVCVNIFF